MDARDYIDNDEGRADRAERDLERREAATLTLRAARMTHDAFPEISKKLYAIWEELDYPSGREEDAYFNRG
jgi:hypothetical protein